MDVDLTRCPLKAPNSLGTTTPVSYTPVSPEKTTKTTDPTGVSGRSRKDRKYQLGFPERGVLKEVRERPFPETDDTRKSLNETGGTPRKTIRNQREGREMVDLETLLTDRTQEELGPTGQGGPTQDRRCEVRRG